MVCVSPALVTSSRVQFVSATCQRETVDIHLFLGLNNRFWVTWSEAIRLGNVTDTRHLNQLTVKAWEKAGTRQLGNSSKTARWNFLILSNFDKHDRHDKTQQLPKLVLSYFPVDVEPQERLDKPCKLLYRWPKVSEMSKQLSFSRLSVELYTSKSSAILDVFQSLLDLLFILLVMNI